MSGILASTVIIGKRGGSLQMTIPKDMRRRLDLIEGDRVRVELSDQKLTVTKDDDEK